MTGSPTPSDQYRNRLLALIAVVLGIAALRAGYPVVMPLLFAGVIVAALWPLKICLDRWMPSWLSYVVTMSVLVALLAGFAAAVTMSVGQMLGVIGKRWPDIESGYNSIARWGADWGVVMNGAADKGRIYSVVTMLASSVYSLVTYIGFIGLLVLLGLPEVPRLHEKMHTDLSDRTRGDLREMLSDISRQVQGYLGTTLATSALTGVVSLAWALLTGLELPFVWGLLNFLLNFIPVIGNIIGIIPPTLYAFVQFGGIWMPALVFVGFATLQLVISNFVYPILQGRRLSLSPLAIIVAMTFWSWVWGFAGALIAVPLTAAGVIVCRQFKRTRWFARLLSA